MAGSGLSTAQLLVSAGAGAAAAVAMLPSVRLGGISFICKQASVCVATQAGWNSHATPTRVGADASLFRDSCLSCSTCRHTA